MNVLLYGCLILMLLVPPPLGDISSPFIPHYLPSSLWYVYTPNGETPPGPSKSPPSPPKSHFHTASLTVPLPYTSSHGPAPLLPSSSTPSKSPPTVSSLSSGSGTPPSNFYCYRLSWSQRRGRPTTVAGSWHLSIMRPYLLQSSDVGSCGGAVSPLPSFSFLTHSSGCSASPRGHGCRSACAWGGIFGNSIESWCCSPSSVF